MPPSAIQSLVQGLSIGARDLSHTYQMDDRAVPVLRDLQLTVPAGGYVSITGASGTGKTTLLTLIGGLDTPQSGTLRVGPFDLTALRGDALAAYRRASVGFVFQHSGLLEPLTALENVELAFALSGKQAGLRRREAGKLLTAVGLEERARHQPARLSGGERQRVAIARALANRPGLLLADEPTGNLDETSGERVIGLLEELHSATGCTLLLVTHNPALARRADQQLLLTGGELVPA